MRIKGDGRAYDCRVEPEAHAYGSDHETKNRRFIALLMVLGTSVTYDPDSDTPTTVSERHDEPGVVCPCCGHRIGHEDVPESPSDG